MAEVVVVDASAVLAFLKGEEGAARIADRLGTALISSVNLCEVIKSLIDAGLPPRDAAAASLSLGLQVAALDADLAVRAGEMHAETRHAGLSLGDRCCLALAESTGLPAATTDRAWATLDVGASVELLC